MPTRRPPCPRPTRLPAAVFNRTRLLMMLGAAWSLGAAPLASHAAPAAETVSVRNYQIAAGPLLGAINQFATEAGIALTFDANALQNETSPGIQGRYTVDEGLRQVLATSSWQARRTPSGAYVLERKPAAQTATLAPVTVTGMTDLASTEASGTYGGHTTTVFKGAQSVRRTPQPVTVMSRQFIDDRVMPDLHDVMQNTPGVTVDYTDSERVNYYSRGFQIDSLQIDGLNVYQSGSAFIQPDTAVLDRVEILRGAAGLLKGAGNPSATVNLVRKRPTPTFEASARLTAGSWDRRRGEVDISGPLNEAGTLRGRIVGVVDNKEFFQKAREEKRRVFYGVLQADLTDRTTLTASFQHTELKATGAWGGLPADFDGSSLDLPRDTYLGADWNHWNRYNDQASLELEHRFDNDWTVKASASNMRFRYFDGGFKQTYITRASTTNPYLFDITTSIYPETASDQNALALVADGPFTLLGRKHHMTVGLESSYNRATNAKGYFNVAPMNGFDIRDWDPYTSYPEPNADSPGTYYEPTNNKTEQQAVYAVGRFSLADPLTLLVGARATWWDYKVPENPASNYSVDREITPYVGAVYDLNDNFSLYGSYSEIFVPQNAYSAGGNLLDPITGEDYEAGIKGEFFEGRLNFAASVFRINNTGRAMDDANSPNPCVPYYASGYCKVAGGKTRSQGWELELAGEITPNWNIMAGYTNTMTKYLRDASESNVGQPIRTGDPRHLLRLFTTYRMPGALQGLTIGGGVQAQSSIYASSRGIVARQPGYAVYNLMAAYDFNRNLRLQVNVNNLFDKTYYRKVDATGISNYYGDPRNVMVTLSARM
ncbi:TonB-dependent siderophore receptor [Bordetella petrii]|uniref:TonB-dependent siderophore receptor n=1 Tax=Bordetella petrii TaxID=94624 RepID=UPI001E53C203|nr:TonB-dependent receptor [Bordetella petrii]MCD0501657.1 TonB-dependent receptor [Bordetella petrii]